MDSFRGSAELTRFRKVLSDVLGITGALMTDHSFVSDFTTDPDDLASMALALGVKLRRPGVSVVSVLARMRKKSWSRKP
jgi:hypothetical protein